MEKQALAALDANNTNEAFRLLMVTYGDHLQSFLMRLMRHRESAEDVKQQAFIEAFEGIEKFQRRSSFWSWIWKIAYNRSVDFHRRNKRIGDVGDFDVWLEGSLQPQVDRTSDVHKQRGLEKCLGKMDVQIRAQLLMRHNYGLSYDEIGELVGDEPGTVQVRISRALPKLRKCLGMEGLR